jgi:Na+/H+-dicarboxylate symporter
MILALQVSHFTAAFTWAIFASVVFGITQRNTPREMLQYGLKCLAWFIVAGLFLAGWAMWLLHH